MFIVDVKETVEDAPQKTATKPKKAGPSVSDLIVKAVSASKERSGVSLAALKKALAAGGYDVEKNNSRVNTAVKSLVSKDTLLQTKGVGASGSFKLNNKRVKKPRKSPNKTKRAATLKEADNSPPKARSTKRKTARTRRKVPRRK
ncbi:histone H1-like isoform X2 [Acipenser ruthenus]|uniref:histone H1-like isoform X2 n=1 Tax=Acipenser ruthenus TaxID=7906 RepID=UPI0027419E1F|nr:histone H1-like isoform X2 [Acipenser ruthenus]